MKKTLTEPFFWVGVSLALIVLYFLSLKFNWVVSSGFYRGAIYTFGVFLGIKLGKDK